ncbi:MAG TPA: YdiU family protein [Ideonella sp.]|nr:YdiU family protein [Ideonella sp.]
MHTTWPPEQARWTNRFARLAAAEPGAWGTFLGAQPFPEPHWVATSEDAAALIGLPADWAAREDASALLAFTGQAPWPGMQPLATVYSGHQFGAWAGQLGDGRALMLGELEAPAAPGHDAPARWELQIKGAGRTPYSRMGDGRAVLRSSIREFLCSEAMAALGVPTTRALCVAGSPLPVRRETMETAAIVTRLAPSFLRIGHYEHFAHHGQPERLRQLVEFTLREWFPDCLDPAAFGDPDVRTPVHAWLAEVVRRTAETTAHWMAVGFEHGVMNTDNLSVLGLTIDYGPFGFLDAYDPGWVCNHTDTTGRYAFGRQPNVAWWNLHALGHALRDLCERPDDELPPLLDRFGTDFMRAYSRHLRAKLGLAAPEPEDQRLAEDFLRLLAADRVDHTIAFRRLSAVARDADALPATVRDLFIDPEGIADWGARYLARLRREPRGDDERRAAMDATNPRYILRNHLAHEAVQAAQQGDFEPVRRLHALLRRPFDEQPGLERYADFPPEWAGRLELSCSS